MWCGCETGGFAAPRPYVPADDASQDARAHHVINSATDPLCGPVVLFFCMCSAKSFV